MIAALLPGRLPVDSRWLRPAAGAARPLRDRRRAVSSAAISPDGRQLAIASRGKLSGPRSRPSRDSRDRRNRRRRSGRSGRRTAARSPTAPTGSFGRCLAEAGTPSAICELAGGLWDDDAGGAWLSDGTIVFSNGNAGLWQVSAQGGDPVEVLKVDPKQELDFHTASALPDGRSVVYVIHRAAEGAGADTLGIWSGGKARRMFEVEGAVPG